MRRRLLVLALVLPLAAPSAAGAAVCDPPPKHRVTVRGAQAVVLVRVESPYERTYRMCSRRSGRITELVRTYDYGDMSYTATFATLGRWVATITLSDSRYEGDESTGFVVRDAHTGAVATVGHGIGRVPVVLGPRGRAALVEAFWRRPLVLWSGDERREVAFADAQPISDVRFDGDVLRWSAGGAPREYAAPPPTPFPGFADCRVRSGERVAAWSSTPIFERARAGRSTFRACVDRTGPDPPAQSWTLGTFGGRGARVERVVVAHAPGGAAAVFERVTRRGRSRLRVRALDVAAETRFGGWLGGWSAARRVELVDAVAGPGGVAWLLREDRVLRIAARSPAGLVRVRERLPLSVSVGGLVVGGGRVTWRQNGAERSRPLP